MSTIVFHGAQGFAQITLERTAELKIVGGVISAGGPNLASLHNGAWHLGSQRFERVTCRGPVRVEIQAKTGLRSFGPFDELTISGDVVYTTEGILARYQSFDEIWYFDRHSETEALVVKDATDLLAA